MMGRRLALLVAAGAESYPARPITLVVPYAAGGVFDTIARIIGARMGELLGQSVIVENVTGGKEAPALADPAARLDRHPRGEHGRGLRRVPGISLLPLQGWLGLPQR